MTRRRTSPEDLLQSSLAPDRAKHAVDVGLAYDDGEGSIEGLGVGLCAKNLPGPVELALVEPNVLVTQGGCGRHVTSASVYMIRRFVYIDFMLTVPARGRSVCSRRDGAPPAAPPDGNGPPRPDGLRRERPLPD